MLTFELKRVEIWPLFRITFFVSASLFSLFFLLLGNSLMEMSAMLSESMGGPGGGGAGQLGIMGILFGAVMNAFLFSGFVAAGGALYNFFSQQFGGYVFNFDGDFELETVYEEDLPAAESAAAETLSASAGDDVPSALNRVAEAGPAGVDEADTEKGRTADE